MVIKTKTRVKGRFVSASIDLARKAEELGLVSETPLAPVVVPSYGYGWYVLGLARLYGPGKLTVAIQLKTKSSIRETFAEVSFDYLAVFVAKHRKVLVNELPNEYDWAVDILNNRVIATDAEFVDYRTDDAEAIKRYFNAINLEFYKDGLISRRPPQLPPVDIKLAVEAELEEDPNDFEVELLIRNAKFINPKVPLWLANTNIHVISRATAEIVIYEEGAEADP